MVQTITDFAVILTGIIFIFILFNRFPALSRKKESSRSIPKISVIIPARNEENNLPLLIADLSNQSCMPDEIICIDDDSTDNTAQIATSFGVKVISLKNKPQGWVGKSWACQNGADEAKGDIYIFLDADVRLSSNGLDRLIQTYLEYDSTISVQPFHKTKKIYESFSLFFNLLQIAANGTSLPKQTPMGLYGPVIVMPRFVYESIGGHKSIRSGIVEDMELGKLLKKKNIPFHLFVGDKDVSFRMYGGGIKSLFQGWVKNIGSCAVNTPLHIFIMVFFWITSMTSVPIQILLAGINDITAPLILYSFIYAIWVMILFYLSGKAGLYAPVLILFYPVLLLALFVILSVSLFKKIFRISVIWKDRKV